MAFFGDKPLELPEPTSFQTAIRFTSAQSIHKATGRAIVLGEEIYYSPNSSRTPLMPPPPTQAYTRDPVTDSVEEFYNPRWWTPQAAYLPFLPTSPNFQCPPFHTLFNNPVTHGPRRKYRIQMDSNDILNWNRLENTLTQLFRSFQTTYSIPDMPPIIRTSLVCQKEFEFPSQFTTAEKRCRNWFAVWMAMVSFGIAVAEISDGHGEANMVPKWYYDFVRHTDEPTLSGIRQQLGQFTESFSRAGVFVDLCDSQEQPTVDFFVHLNVPVWYRWGPKEESHARNNPNYWQRYFPPAHLLQKAHSFLIVDPVLLQAVEADADRPWIAFFADRETRATGPMPRKKPTLKIFHWEKDLNSGIWNRIAVVRRFARETLAEYGKRQKHYDERSNEWDCATEMGEKDAEELQAEDWDNSDNEPILPIGARPSPLIAAPAIIYPIADNMAPRLSNPLPCVRGSFSLPNTGLSLDPGPAAIDSGKLEYYHPEEHSPTEALSLFYGFVAPPPSVRVALPPISELHVKDLALGIGCSSKEEIQDYAQTAVGKCASHFFWSMTQSPWVPPPNVLFDLAVGNPRSLKHRRRLKFLRQLPGSTYIFDFQRESTVEWKICVTDITLVLFIARLDDNLSDYEVAWALLDQGSAFRTMLQVPIFAIKASPTTIPRLRFSDYKFSATDYETYCLERAEILRDPRIARQALMQGGILWRLAIENASFQSVLAGPTTLATSQHRCLSLAIDSKNIWIDDVLDKHEAEIISGVYYVYTGKPSF